ncbi:MAG: AraC family transcriptional regulator [Spirosomataceae bacterium]|jgi:AraC-like DNA-binding protein
MKLLIKNMVCDRCKMVVRSELEKLGLNLLAVELGEVEIDGKLSDEREVQIAERLESVGFSLLSDKKSQVVEKIKTLIISLVRTKNNDLRINLSDYLTQYLPSDYGSLSSLFSEIEGTTIEKYFINQKIERVKELLVYDELTLSEIAHQLHYSSVAHLSNQFKKVTGLSPTNFKNSDGNRRIELDGL